MATPAPSDKPVPRRARPPWRRVAMAVVGAVALYGLVVGVALPPLAQRIAADKLKERLGRVVTIEDVDINPFTLVATVKGFKVMEADAQTPFVAFDLLEVNASAASLYRFAPVADELTLAGLKVRLVRDGESHFNLSDIVERLASAAKAAPPREGKEPARFSVGNIRVVNAAIDFDDRPQGAKHQVKDLYFSIPFISSLPTHLKEYVQPSFSANVNGSALRLTGETLPFENSMRTHFNLDLKQVDLRRYLGYVPAKLPVAIDSGRLDARISVRFTQAAGKEATIDVAGTAALRELALSSPEGPLAQIGLLEVDVASFDPMGGTAKVNSIRVGEASAMGGEWRIPAAEVREAVLDLRKKKARIEAVTSRDAVLNVKRQRDGTIEMPRLAMEKSDKPWSVAVGKVAATGYKVTVLDGTVKPSAIHRVAIVSLEVDELSTDDGLKGTAVAKLALDKGGSLDVTSTFTLDPLLVTAKLDVRKVDLASLRPYAMYFPTVAMTSGAASAKGTLTLRGKGEALRVGYAGSAEIAKLATRDTSTKEDLLNWNSVRTSGIDFDMQSDGPLSLTVADVVVDKVYSRIVVLPDGKLNVQQLRTGASTDPAPTPSATPPRPRNVRIDRITFVDSRLNFTDLFIRPNYSADVGELQGTVTNISSEPESRGVVDLKGRIDQSSPVLIAGTVNPLRADLFLDIAAKAAEIELPKLTAYSQRYAGYGITAGKLTLDVKYHVENGKLEGRNRILVDQLTFGDKVEGPDATKLPVLLAVNLLKDSKGQINLELPITGSLSDPQFEIGALITQVVGNLLKKAITSPFSLLTAAIGGGNGNGSAGSSSGSDDLAFIDFDAGREELDAADRKKLDAVAKALLDRPAIKLELAPRNDAVKDLAALKKAALMEKLAAANAGGARPDEAQYARLLKSEYQRQTRIAAKDAPKEASKEAAREIPAAEMEAYLLERVTIGEPELRGLASRRGARVMQYLVGEGHLSADRVAVSTAAAAQSPAPASRVDLALK